MSFPAYESFGRDIEIGYARWRVYTYLVHRLPLSHAEPRVVKVWFVAEQIPLARRHVIKALDWLTRRGYVVEHGRASRGERMLSLAWAVGDRGDEGPKGYSSAEHSSGDPVASS